MAPKKLKNMPGKSGQDEKVEAGKQTPDRLESASEHEPATPSTETSEGTPVLLNESVVPLAETNHTVSFAVPPEHPLQRAAMLFNDGQLDRLRTLADTASGNAVDDSQQRWYEAYQPYPTTLSLILLLHFVFLCQWNARKTRRQVLVSYRQLVQEKQYFRGVVAYLSHPPLDSSNSRSREGSVAIGMGNEESHRAGRLQQMKDFLHPLIKGHLSGLPLLAYNTHILWSCRALEPLCQSPWHYTSMLMVLVLVSLALELRISRNMLRRSRVLIGLGLVEETATTRRRALHRTMGTATAMTSALLYLYRTALPHTPIPVFPFLSFTSILSPLISYFATLVLLTLLSWPSHSLTSVLFGIVSAFLWTTGILHFLATGYWCWCLVIWIMIACALSFRENESLSAWVPCIDYVAWDARGNVRSRTTAAASGLAAQHGEDIHSDDEDETGDGDENDSYEDPERQPLHPRGDVVIHGRLPQMRMDDLDDAIELPRRNSTALTRQRRGGGTSNPESASQR